MYHHHHNNNNNNNINHYCYCLYHNSSSKGSSSSSSSSSSMGCRHSSMIFACLPLAERQPYSSTEQRLGELASILIEKPFH